MKHLILSGGRPWCGEDGGKSWIQALLAHCDGEARVAFCLFAQEESEHAQTLAGNTELIRKHAGSLSVSFKTLEHQTFEEVSAWANVIVIVGGEPARLKTALEQHGDLLKLWDGKTISGSSAGADIMCQKFMYLQDKEVQQGFGWVAVNFIPHWQAPDWKGWTIEDWRKAEQAMAGQAGEVPLLTVREGAFVEIVVQ